LFVPKIDQIKNLQATYRPTETQNFVTSSSAVAKRPRDASCRSVVSFNGTKRRVVFYC